MADLTSASIRGAVDLSSLVDRANRPAVPEGASPGPVEAIPVPGLILDATDANFQAFLELSNQVPVIVDLWAEWCGPCKQLSPILERIVTEYGGRLLLAKIDVDANPQLSQAFQAQSIPTIAALVAGRPVSLFVGALPEAQVRDVVAQLLELAAENGVTGTVTPPEAAADASDGDVAPEPVEEPLPPLHQAAYDAIEQGDYAGAIASYRKAIAQDPRDTLAVAGLAQVSLLARLEGSSMLDLRAVAAEKPLDLAAQLAVADLDVSGGHVEDAFDRVLDLFPTLDQEGKDLARARLLEYFEIIGAEDARVAAARRRLTMLLY